MAIVDGVDTNEKNASAAAALAAADTPVPDPPTPADDFVDLPGGLVIGDEVAGSATVQELTGEHEEKLANSSQASNFFHFIETLLECGTVKIGDRPATKDLLNSLLIGDRDYLVIAIRKATYGEEVELPGWRCPACGKLSDISFDLDNDVPVERLKDPIKDKDFTVELRKGGEAKVRLPNGSDQVALFADDELNLAERNTILLQRCVSEVTDAKGKTQSVTANPALARKMSIANRRKILKEITQRQPGPRLSDLKITHDSCGKEVSLGVDVGDLFRD